MGTFTDLVFKNKSEKKFLKDQRPTKKEPLKWGAGEKKRFSAPAVKSFFMGVIIAVITAINRS